MRISMNSYLKIFQSHERVQTYQIHPVDTVVLDNEISVEYGLWMESQLNSKNSQTKKLTRASS